MLHEEKSKVSFIANLTYFMIDSHHRLSYYISVFVYERNSLEATPVVATACIVDSILDYYKTYYNFSYIIPRIDHAMPHIEEKL